MSTKRKHLVQVIMNGYRYVDANWHED